MTQNIEQLVKCRYCGTTDYLELRKTRGHQIACSINRGGCGTQSDPAYSPAAAKTKWNWIHDGRHQQNQMGGA